MADRTVDVLLIGGGVASAAAASELVSGGFDGSVLLVGRELDPPYDRPPLTKEYLRGEQGREPGFRPEAGWFDDAPVELLTRTSVMKLDTAAREATLSTKETVAYEHALVATGSMVRRLQVDGTQLDGIHYLRAFGNADAIRAELDQAEHVVCVGGSYIGCEVAASLRAIGKEVTIVMLEDEPMERGFGHQVGAFFRGVLSERGVGVVHADEVDRFEGDERVARVVTKGGRELARRPRRLRRRRHARRDARALGGARARRERRRALRRGPAHERVPRLGRGRRLRVRERGPRPARSASSTPSTRAPRARSSRARSSAPRSRTPRCPTSTATSPTGRRSSTSGRPGRGTRRSSPARSRAASSASGTSSRATCAAR